MNLRANHIVFGGALVVLAFFTWGDLFPDEAEAKAKPDKDAPTTLVATMFDAGERFAPGRNPFDTSDTQLAAQAVVATPSPTGKVDGVDLQGVLMARGFRAAIINGEVYVEGDAGPAGTEPPKWTLRRVNAGSALLQVGSSLVEVAVTIPVVAPGAGARAAVGAGAGRGREGHQP